MKNNCLPNLQLTPTRHAKGELTATDKILHNKITLKLPMLLPVLSIIKEIKSFIINTVTKSLLQAHWMIKPIYLTQRNSKKQKTNLKYQKPLGSYYIKFWQAQAK